MFLRVEMNNNEVRVKLKNFNLNIEVYREIGWKIPLETVVLRAV